MEFHEECELAARKAEDTARWADVDSPSTAESLDAFREYLTTLTREELHELHEYDIADGASYWYLVPLVADEIARRG